MSKQKIMIAGFGQIGQAIYNLYDLEKYEIGHMDKETVCDFAPPADVLHICFGHDSTEYSRKSFIDTVKMYISFFNPKITIIHGTVSQGVTQSIFKEINKPIVHSPVMGVHPHLTESIKTFTKIVGGANDDSAELAIKHLTELGIKTIKYDSSNESEFAKLLDTTYYGICIRYMQDIHRECQEENLNFEQVYTQTNTIYNDGYTKMGMSNVIRPVLKHFGDGIGGHCIWQNSKLLDMDMRMQNFVPIIIEEGHSNIKNEKVKPNAL